MRIFTLLFLTLALSACNLAYKHNIQQGNILNVDKINTIKQGDSRNTVIKTLGNPILETPFSPQTLTYAYSLKDKQDNIQNKHVIFVFQNNRVTAIEKKAI